MKKIIIYILSIITLSLGFFYSPCLGAGINITIGGGDESFPYDEGNETSMKDILRKSNMDDISDDFVGNDVVNQTSPMSYYISKVINYFLVLIAFIAFLVLLYGFSLVFTDKTDEGMKKGYKFIKMATIAIIIIGISWLFSIWIFYIYNKAVVGG